MKIEGKKPDDPQIPRGKPHAWPKGFLKGLVKLPDEFTATDPVSLKTFDFIAKRPIANVQERLEACYSGECWDVIFANTARALIQYGRDLERAEIEEALKVDYAVRREAKDATDQ